MRWAAKKGADMADSWRAGGLRSWIIGLVINVCVIGFIGYRMVTTECPAPGIAEAIVLLVVPTVYLVLMYITLRDTA